MAGTLPVLSADAFLPHFLAFFCIYQDKVLQL